MIVDQSKRSLRVALLTHYPEDDAAPVGGVLTVGRNLALGLAAAGVEVHVVRYRGGRQPLQVIATGGQDIHIHSIGHRLPAAVPRQLSCIPVLASLLQEIEPDAVSAHAPEYALGGARAGLPTLFTIHGVVRREIGAFRHWRHRLPLLLSVLLDREAARRVPHIVALNDYVIREYRGRTKATFHRIDNPIDDCYFEAQPCPPQPQTLLLVGALSERKDPLTLLRALALVRRSLPQVELRVAGAPRLQAFGTQLQRFIQSEGLEEHVRFLGPLDPRQLAPAYAASALTVLASRQETAPLVVMEAMACRRPVVATDVGGVREIVAHGESGLVVPPGDAQAMAQAIEQVLRDPALADVMGRRGRELAEQRYRRDLVAGHYAELLAEISG